MVSKIKRLLRHLWMTRRHVRQVLSEQDFKEIETAIAESEQLHSGEICFAIEAALSAEDILSNLNARDRALEVFGRLRVWDTADNNGVLLYLLLADRQIEIVSDRGVAAIDFEPVCKTIEDALGRSNFKDGIVNGIRQIGLELTKFFPATSRNELPNKPQIL